MNFPSEVGLVLNLLPDFFIGFRSFTFALLKRVQSFLLRLFEGFSLLGLLFLLILNLKVIDNACFQSLLEQTRLIFETDRHVRTKSWHLEEVNVGLFSNFGHN